VGTKVRSGIDQINGRNRITPCCISEQWAPTIGCENQRAELVMSGVQVHKRSCAERFRAAG
jgi:hypothetical protein